MEGDEPLNSNDPDDFPGSDVLEAANPIEAVEYLMQEGMTDGLPVIPPTPERVHEMLDGMDAGPEGRIGTVPERQRVVTIKKAAVNAVMAGCSPEHMPVVSASLKAILDPRLGAHGMLASTSGMALLLVLNGPVVEELDFRSGGNVLGPGNRSNATVSRAVNLTLRNTVGWTREEFDRSTFGHPGKITYCLPEQTTDHWEPFHSSRGFDAKESAVTVFVAQSPDQLYNAGASRAEPLARSIVQRMSCPGLLGFDPVAEDGEVVIVVGPEHRRIFAKDGWSKSDLRRFVVGHAQVSVHDLKESDIDPEPTQPGDEERRVHLVEDPENVFVIAAGGDAGPFSLVIPGQAGRRLSQAVTVGINDI